jgi:hypothetical protein
MLYVWVKCHNKTCYFVQLIYANKNNGREDKNCS